MNIGETIALQNEGEYEAALKTVRSYFENEPDAGTPQDVHFDRLALLIEAYENIHYPMAGFPAGKAVAPDR